VGSARIDIRAIRECKVEWIGGRFARVLTVSTTGGAAIRLNAELLRRNYFDDAGENIVDWLVARFPSSKP
jgi:hypothetical protein